MPNLQLNKLKPGIKNDNKITLKISSDVILMMRIIFHISCYSLIHKFQRKSVGTQCIGLYVNGNISQLKLSIYL